MTQIDDHALILQRARRRNSRKARLAVKLVFAPMILRTVASLLLLATFSTAQTTPPSTPASSPDKNAQQAHQLLDQMIQALGGQAYMTMQDMSEEGRAYSFYQGKPSSLGTLFWLFWKFPDKQRVELTKQRDVVTVNNGNEGYDITYRGTALEEKEQLQTYLRNQEHSMQQVLRVWMKSPKLALFYDGPAVTEQKPTDSVTIMSGDDSVTIFIDRYTHLPVKKTFDWRDPIDRLRNTEAEIFDNYRNEQGIMTPHIILHTRNGETTGQRFITSVKYNTGLADSMFEAKVTYDPYKTSQRKK